MVLLAGLRHLNSAPKNPATVIVIGAGGFVGGAAADRMRAAGITVDTPSRSELDLLDSHAAANLAARIKSGATLVLTAARAPCKDPLMLTDNCSMFVPIREILESVDLGHVVYVSSDAVYPDEPVPLSEVVPAAPATLHGVMHLAREVILQTYCRAPLAIIRPTLIYGAADPHNGYGPNRFRRLAAEGEEIVLFGEGEERRDHVMVDDVAELILRIVQNRSEGTLNAATGSVASFREIADLVVEQYPNPVEIKGSPRTGPMPHNGYRPFDPSATAAAFADFQYTPLEEGVAAVHRAIVR